MKDKANTANLTELSREHPERSVQILRLKKSNDKEFGEKKKDNLLLDRMLV